jgi:capsular exopolysaccharide synthesis family protein
MGKIESALRRAKMANKQVADKAQADKRRASNLQVPADPDREVWAGTPELQLDTGVMARERIVLGLPPLEGAEIAYKMLRTRVLKTMRSNGWSSIIVTSPNKGAGKSVTSINLAVSLAREENLSIYLVDTDLRRPSLHNYLGVEDVSCDLTQYLAGKAGLQDIIVRSDVQRLYFVLNTTQHKHSAELLTSQKMKQFVDDLQRRAGKSIIIFDMPPMLMTDDVLAFCPQADAVLLVAAQSGTKRDDLATTLSVLEGSNLLGVVLNKSNEIVDEYGYYY